MGKMAVEYESADQIGVLTLNRPDQRNAMSAELLDAFDVEIRKAHEDREIRALVITGRGSCFSAGADLRASLQRDDLGKPSAETSYAMYEPFLRVLDIEVPVVAALNGHTVGGGFGLALLADIRVANRDSKYGANFARLGIHSGLGISYVLPKLVGPARAAELLFTGSLIRGDEAERIGLVTHAVSQDEVLPTAFRIARSIAISAPLAVQAMKASIRRGLGWEVRDAARAEAALQAQSLTTEDAAEGISAILQKREPEFRGRYGAKLLNRPMSIEAPTLPIPLDEVPETLRRFADPNGPTPARMMAAKGMVPVKGADLVLILVQLSADGDPGVSSAAEETLTGLPENVLLPACKAALPAGVLHAVALRFSQNDDVLARLASNHATSDATVAHISSHCPERITEIIAVNQQRLLGAPAIIEALYKNKHTRMSTADRLIELAARHDVELSGIPMFDELKKAIQGQLIPEPSEEALPADELFSKALEEDTDQDAVDRDKVDGTEETKEEFVPLQAKIRNMNIGEKIRLALLGNAAARSILVRDPNRIVAMAAIASPAISENEAKNAAQSREVSEDVLRYIGKKREWLRSYEIKRYLVNNPKTPLALSMGFLAHLRRNDLRTLSRSRGIPGPLKQAAKRRAKQFD